jgi:hypothetical protein
VVTDPIVWSVGTSGDLRYDALISFEAQSCEETRVVYLSIYMDGSLP